MDQVKGGVPIFGPRVFHRVNSQLNARSWVLQEVYWRNVGTKIGVVRICGKTCLEILEPNTWPASKQPRLSVDEVEFGMSHHLL